MSDLTFTTPARRTEPTTFTLDGETYEFTPPKTAGMVLDFIGANGAGEVTAVKSLFDWLGDGLPDEQMEHLTSRLRDPDDDLDIDTLSDVARSLIEAVAARPTPAPSG